MYIPNSSSCSVSTDLIKLASSTLILTHVRAIFINDLPLVLQNVYADLYVDDTTLHKSSSSVSVVNVELNTDLHNVVEWCHENDKYSSNVCVCVSVFF
jgi:LEA14-like dessication related protein